jgi:hypothetical protein
MKATLSNSCKAPDASRKLVCTTVLAATFAVCAGTVASAASSATLARSNSQSSSSRSSSVLNDRTRAEGLLQLFTRVPLAPKTLVLDRRLLRPRLAACPSLAKRVLASNTRLLHTALVLVFNSYFRKAAPSLLKFQAAAAATKPTSPHFAEWAAAVAQQRPYVTAYVASLGRPNYCQVAKLALPAHPDEEALERAGGINATALSKWNRMPAPSYGTKAAFKNYLISIGFTAAKAKQLAFGPFSGSRF